MVVLSQNYFQTLLTELYCTHTHSLCWQCSCGKPKDIISDYERILLTMFHHIANRQHDSLITYRKKEHFGTTDTKGRLYFMNQCFIEEMFYVRTFIGK